MVDASVDIIESSEVPKVPLAVIGSPDALNVLIMHAEVEGGNGSTDQGPDIEESRVGIGCAEGTLEAGDNTLSGSTANHGDASRLVGLLVDIRFPHGSGAGSGAPAMHVGERHDLRRQLQDLKRERLRRKADALLRATVQHVVVPTVGVGEGSANGVGGGDISSNTGQLCSWELPGPSEQQREIDKAKFLEVEAGGDIGGGLLGRHIEVPEVEASGEIGGRLLGRRAEVLEVEVGGDTGEGLLGGHVEVPEVEASDTCGGLLGRHNEVLGVEAGDNTGEGLLGKRSKVSEVEAGDTGEGLRGTGYRSIFDETGTDNKQLHHGECNSHGGNCSNQFQGQRGQKQQQQAA